MQRWHHTRNHTMAVPSAEIECLAARVKRHMVVELNAGQMIEDVCRLACHDSVPYTTSDASA